MTGRQLYQMYVAHALCTDATYSWEHLSAEMQRRWEALALAVSKLPGAFR